MANTRVVVCENRPRIGDKVYVTPKGVMVLKDESWVRFTLSHFGIIRKSVNIQIGVVVDASDWEYSKTCIVLETLFVN